MTENLFDLFTETGFSIPAEQKFLDSLEKVNLLLQNEESYDNGAVLRPHSKNKTPGGLVLFNDDTPVILVPDLHARYFFLDKILKFRPFGKMATVLELLKKDKIRLVFVGDALHSEVVPGYDGWRKSYAEYRERNFTGPNMSVEMALGLNLVMGIIALKLNCPKNVHFLKGNHDNILNENVNGNHGFYKYVEEGSMTRSFMEHSYSPILLETYSRYEHLLPLFVKGRNFLISHAEPICAFSQNDLIDFDDYVVEGLTWTDNGEVFDTATQMLEKFIPQNKNALYFAGHRPVKDAYNALEGGRFIQIHNPMRDQIFLLNPKSDFDFSNDIIDLSDEQNKRQ